MEAQVEGTKRYKATLKEGLLKLCNNRQQQDQILNGLWDEMMQTQKRLEKLDSIEGLLTSLLKLERES